jgi:hypothetical protein
MNIILLGGRELGRLDADVDAALPCPVWFLPVHPYPLQVAGETHNSDEPQVSNREKKVPDTSLGTIPHSTIPHPSNLKPFVHP